MTDTPVSLIVVSRHRTASLLRTIAAVRLQDYAALELIVVADPQAAQAILQNLTPDQFADASKLTVQPFFIEQSGPPTGDQLVRDWPAVTLGVDKHRGYAFQWYALAAMALIFFVVTGFRRGTK